jgi:hypothetical protein
MNANSTNKKLESLKLLIIPIEKEMLEITNMASEISEKFQGISRNIKSLSGVVGGLAGRKAGVVTSLVGEVFSVFGDIRADEERQRALRKLLPKKIELANLKTGIISQFRDNLNNQIESLSLLLIEEVNRPYDETKYAEYEDLYGNSCLDAFDLYVSSYYMIQLCDFMLIEFSTWIKYKHESGVESPDKSVVLDIVLNEIIFPNGLKNGLSTSSSNAGIWLLSKRESIISGSMYKTFSEGKRKEVKYEIRIFKRKSFISLKTYVSEIKKTASEDKTDNLKILTNSSIYKQANNICNIRSPKKYFFNIAFLVMFSLLFITGIKEIIIKGISVDIILNVLLVSIVIAFIHSLVTLFWLWQKNIESDFSFYELIFKFLITVISLGTVPLFVYLYERKENRFEKFINKLRTD